MVIVHICHNNIDPRQIFDRNVRRAMITQRLRLSVLDLDTYKGKCSLAIRDRDTRENET